MRWDRSSALLSCLVSHCRLTPKRFTQTQQVPSCISVTKWQMFVLLKPIVLYIGLFFLRGSFMIIYKWNDALIFNSNLYFMFTYLFIWWVENLHMRPFCKICEHCLHCSSLYVTKISSTSPCKPPWHLRQTAICQLPSSLSCYQSSRWSNQAKPGKIVFGRIVVTLKNQNVMHRRTEYILKKNQYTVS